ncbi:MAG TPA: LLM class F420-dependent oxidoreductase [Microthrixaceae bacterium]|nr:LLM class F420-dependent oxidoreductase [Microthrixaceae bacterium]
MQNPHIDIGTYGIWTGALDMVPSAVAGEATAELDELGYGAVWIPETVFREPFVHAALLMAASPRIKVATGIVNRYGRDPLAANAAMQTLNEAFPGRFLLGLGVSHEHLVAWVRKHDYSRPYSGMVEYLDAMAKARFFAPRGDPPAQMVLAALGPRMLALAAERTAGAHTYFVPPEHTAIARETMGPEPLLAVEQMVVLDTDPATARETARQHMAVYLSAPNYTNNLARLGFGPEDVADGGSDRLVDAIVVLGDLDDVLGRIRSHLDAGADHVCVQVLHPDMAHLPRAEWRELSAALGLTG